MGKGGGGYGSGASKKRCLRGVVRTVAVNKWPDDVVRRSVTGSDRSLHSIPRPKVDGSEEEI